MRHADWHADWHLSVRLHEKGVQKVMNSHATKSACGTQSGVLVTPMLHTRPLVPPTNSKCSLGNGHRITFRLSYIRISAKHQGSWGWQRRVCYRKVVTFLTQER